MYMWGDLNNVGMPTRDGSTVLLTGVGNKPNQEYEDLKNWLYSVGIGYATRDDKLPIQGENCEPFATCWRWSNENGATGVIVFVWSTSPDVTNYGAKPDAYDNLIPYTRITAKQNPANLERVIFTDYPLQEPTAANPNPVVSNSYGGAKLLKALRGLADNAGITGPAVFDVYRGNINQGQVLLDADHGALQLFARCPTVFGYAPANEYVIRNVYKYAADIPPKPLKSDGWIPKGEDVYSLLQRLMKATGLDGLERYEGNAAATIGGGLIGGVGSGLSNWSNQQHDLNMLGQEWSNRSSYNNQDWRNKTTSDLLVAQGKDHLDERLRRADFLAAQHNLLRSPRAITQEPLALENRPTPRNPVEATRNSYPRNVPQQDRNVAGTPGMGVSVRAGSYPNNHPRVNTNPPEAPPQPHAVAGTVKTDSEA